MQMYRFLENLSLQRISGIILYHLLVTNSIILYIVVFYNISFFLEAVDDVII